MTWTPNDETAAADQGWLLNTDLDPDFYMVGVEKIDDPAAWPGLGYDRPKFQSDDEALLYVLQKAAIDDPLALKALNEIHNADMARSRRCQYCGVTEPKLDGQITTRIAPHLGACMDCINDAMRVPS